MPEVSWVSPLVGVLKLNFDGSFVQPRRGGVGGVLRDCNSIVLWSYYGPVVCSNANESEVFALLVGCRELQGIKD